jgi:phosphatidylglycerol:prolipoprotein diacylglycerol transferase
MLPYPKIDPNIIEIGPLKLRWYGLMYVLGFLSAYFLIGKQATARRIGLQGRRLQDLIFYLAIGLIIGARFGYILFYQISEFSHYIQHPLEIIAIWHGGMSFHGGLIGALLAGAIFCRKYQMPFWAAADAVIITAPVGLGFGRMGNFINAELFGRPSSVPWAMVFPGGGPLPRHPSQLYEVALEGVLLFVILWRLKDRGFRPGSMVCLFLSGYGVFRFFVEFFREPDPQIGLFWDMFSMGQFLCMAMILTAVILWTVLKRTAPSVEKSRGSSRRKRKRSKSI